MADPLTTSAIRLGFSAASWLISPLLTRFLNKCFDALDIDPQFQSQKQILLVKLEKLQTTLLPQLLILTDAAQQSPHRPFLEKWLQKLKSAFYEAEHVLGLIEYQRLEKEVNYSLFPSTSKCNFKKLIGKIPKFSSEKKYLIKSLENLADIVNEAMEFVTPLMNLPSSRGHSLTQSSNEQYRKTISVPSSTVIGREKDRDYIVKLLRENFPESSSNAKCYSVIGLWGMGGLGKTTLAQYVCDHEREAKYFDRVMWAHVSQKFSVDAILRMIWESAFKEACPNFDGLEGLQSALQEKLRGERYFLVLDDVWCNKGVSEQEIELLFVPLRVGKRGSKILVTTRIEEAAKALGAMNPIPLRELEDEQFMLIFISNAIGDVQINDNNMMGRLTSIGEKIAVKLCRSPLAAKIVAAQLRRKLDPEFWLSMLNRSLINDTMGALFLSYQHLPPLLQRCFAFCSLFPKGHQFDHDHLVNLWIAEGFIETEDSNEHMKDIANGYILELISSSFFQVNKWNSKRYSMHDLMHDLAEYASEGEYFRIESGEKKEIPAHTRHIYVENHMLGEYVAKICKLNDLRTIISCKSHSNLSLKEGDLDALFSNLRKLYVVEIEGISFQLVPKSVIQLRNLRYLNFDIVREDTLYVLNRLYQLRFLYIWRQIPNVGRLVSLQELKRFDVEMERGFELKQLEHLKELFESLSICGLKRVKCKEEADQANLSDKKYLHKLFFSWGQNCCVMRDIDAEILDGLCPPPQIKELVIKEYGGKRLPSWIIENNDNIIHLQHLELADCGGLEALHRINELSSLLSLVISFLPRLKCWVPLPLNLTRLEISSCLSLAFVLKEDLEMIMSTKGTWISQILTFAENFNFSYGEFYVDFQFSCVSQMMRVSGHIENETLSTLSNDLKKCLEKRLDLICQLKDVSGELFLHPALEDLSIKTCFITDKILSGSLQGLTSLTRLSLEDIITFTCISKEVLSSLTNLLKLHIKGCLLLTSIGGLDTHVTLTELIITSCPNLTFETSLVVASNSDTIELTSSSHERKTRSSILKHVSLGGCLPSDDMLEGLVSVEHLDVSKCPTVVNPHLGHLKALGVLKLRDCPTIVNVHLGHSNPLSVLTLDDCPNLASLRGFSGLNNLKRLEVLFGCDKLKFYSDVDKLPQLKELRISRISLLEQLVSRDGFSSLVSLTLFGAQEEYFSQEECEVFHYLSSLEEIIFNRCAMRMLPKLMCLHSLINMHIYGCINLSSLPEVPPSVQRIQIVQCSAEFTRSCKDPNHPNWHKISHVPRKVIYIGSRKLARVIEAAYTNDQISAVNRAAIRATIM